MGAADTAKLVASLTLDAKGFNQGVKTANASIGKLEGTIGKVGKRAGEGLASFGKNIGLIGIAAAGGIAVAVKGGLSNLAELETAITSVDGAIEQLGLTGQITGKQVADMANKIERDIGAAFDDKQITAAANTLLRFGKVTPKNLEQALVVMTDLAAKTGDVESASNLLAKALADPAKAAGKLAKSGVVLTKAQQATIKAMVEQNDVAGAQKFILDELAKTTGGAALASQGKYARSIAVLNDVVEDAQKALATGFLPVIEKVADRLSTAVADPAFLRGLEDFGKELAGGLDDLIDVASKLPWATIGESLKIAGAGAKAVLTAFTSLPPWVQTAVITGWGLNKLTGGALGDIVGELGKGLIKGVLGMNAAVVNINAAHVNGVGGGLPGAAPAAAAGGLTGGAIATAVAVPIILVGGAAISLNAIAEAAQRNNDLARAGLTADEITAQKYYNLSKADQETAFKRLGGQIPPLSVFESGNRKLDGVQATIADGGKKQNVANERLESIRNQQSRAAAKAIADSQSERSLISQQTARAIADSQSEKVATAAAGAKAAAAAREAGLLMARRIDAKDLSVQVATYTTLNAKFNISQSILTQQTFRNYYRTNQ